MFTHKVKRAAIAAMMVTAATGAAAGCGSSSSGGSGGSGDGGGKATIAVAVPTSGPDAALGVPIANAVKLAVRQAQQAGDLPGELTVVVEDDQEKPEVGATLARKFCGDEGTIAAIGNLASSVTLGTQPVFDGCGMAQITPTASADELTDKGYERFFRTTATNSAEAAGGAAYLKSHLPDATSTATIDANDSTTVGLATAFANAFADNVGTVVAREHITSGATDFRGVLTKIIGKKPDVLYLSLFFNDAALISKQARELGYTGQILAVDASVTPDFIKVAGPRAAEGVLMSNLGLDPAKTASARAFTQAFRDAYGEAPNTYAANAYDAANVIIEAWKQAGAADRDKIAEAIAKTSYDGTQGAIAFDANGDLRNPQVGMFGVKNGEIVFVGPAT
jgi:branched-chain amino acid transport system substrate-binding protein